MRRACAVLALTLLAGCGDPTPRSSPDLNTPAGYRQGTLVRAERLAGAVNTAHTRCTSASVEQCGQALKEQQTVVLKTPELAPFNGRPLVCDHLAMDYSILMESARDYFVQARASVGRQDQAGVRQTVAGRMVSFNQSWTAFNNALPADMCQ